MLPLLASILPKLDRGDSPDSKWPSGKGEYWARCPYHDDKHASNFSVSERGFHCFSCGQQGKLSVLADKLGITPATVVPHAPGCTLAEYADAKRIPPGFLASLGIREVLERRGKDRISVLHIPYKDETGQVIATRRRQALRKGPNGKDERFLWAKGAQLLPYGLERLGEAKTAGWALIVEGESDCHTAWLAGLPCLGVPGAQNWKAEWAKYVQGLQCYLWKEPDQAGERFVALVRRSLEPSATHVLAAPEGIKDLSEAHSKGQDVKALVEQIKAQALPAVQAPAVADEVVERERYELTPSNEIYLVRPKPVYFQGTQVATNWQRLRVTNFSAQISHEIQRRDGEHLESLYTIAGRSDRPFAVEVGGEEFRDERKARGIIGNAAGARAIIYEARHLPLAIQELSNGFDSEIRYLSTGWQMVNGQLAFVTPQSGAGYCEVSEDLKRYCVAPGDLAQGIDALVQGLLEAFPHEQSYFCVAHAFLAPLYHWMTGAKRYVLHLVGETGSLKTAYACALLCLYGPGFVDEEPTEKWTSTIGKIERMGHEAKDVLYVVDDYKTRYVRLSDVTSLIQNYSESRGRGRLNRDATIKQTFWIRGAMLSTGEDIPEGEASVISRMLIVRLARPQGSNERLRYAQDRAGSLNAVMYEYTRWLAEHTGQGDDIAIDQQITAWRDAFMAQCPDNSTNPGRLATNLAQNKLAWSMLGRFLQAKGAWSAEEAQQRMAEYDTYAGGLLTEMAGRIQKEKASNTFLTAIRAMLEAGRATLTPRDSSEEPRLGQEFLGWKDADYVYLLPDAAFHAAEQWYRSVGQSMGFSRQAIEAQLLDDGVLVRQDAEHLTKVMRVQNKLVRVLKLVRRAIEETNEAEAVQDDLPF